jgi:hypothetical protein
VEKQGKVPEHRSQIQRLQPPVRAEKARKTLAKKAVGRLLPLERENNLPLSHGNPIVPSVKYVEILAPLVGYELKMQSLHRREMLTTRFKPPEFLSMRPTKCTDRSKRTWRPYVHWYARLKSLN